MNIEIKKQIESLSIEEDSVYITFKKDKPIVGTIKVSTREQVVTQPKKKIKDTFGYVVGQRIRQGWPRDIAEKAPKGMSREHAMEKYNVKF